MANSPKFAGKEAREKLGWWHAYRFLFWRRLTQFGILMMFLSGPYFGVWILKGNYSGSLLFDVIPLSDPLITLELRRLDSPETGHSPNGKNSARVTLCHFADDFSRQCSQRFVTVGMD